MKPCWILIAVLIMAAPSFGQEPSFPSQVQVIADTPAATLLLPYFEVDLSNPSGKTTIFSIGDASENAILTHVVIYTDLGVPVADFDVYLTGFDVQAINLRDVLNGHLPQTASAGQDPVDTISPKGPLSQDINYGSCLGKLPPTGLISPAGVTPAILKKELTGGAGLGGLCYGLSHHDNIARGYVTVDTVNGCTTKLPSDAGYFAAGGSGDAANRAMLTGEAFYINPSLSLARGGNLVHIHASSSDPATSTSGRYTFYGRYDNWTAVDNRQPLATNFGARFKAPAAIQSLNNSHLHDNTSLIVWRDPKVNQGGFTCGNLPTWYPLDMEGFIVFDEQEHVEVPFSGNQFPFPAATQLVQVGNTGFPVSFSSGWLKLDLNTTVTAAGSNPPVDPAAAQAFVTVIDSLFGTTQVEHRASQEDSGTKADHAVN
jgi:hypothetical protein